MEHLERCKRLLAQKGFSITKPRLAVFEALTKASDPLAVTEIVDALPEVDKVSVYRTIDLFEKVGIVQRVWSGFKSKVELSEAFSPHHHHFTCTRCGTMVGLHSEKLEQELATLEAKHGFKLTHHSIELSGFCGKCKPA